MRVAREIHMPISQVMDMPVHELNLWAAVFKAEYMELHPDEREEADSIEADIMPSKAFALLGGEIKGGA